MGKRTVREPSRMQSREMFNRVAHRYDFLNRVLSCGIDIMWRRRLASFLSPREGQYVLDLATGTGDQVLGLFHAGSPVQSAVGMDVADKMLQTARRKILKAGLSQAISLVIGTATRIPSKDRVFDAVTISFGIRNVVDVSQSLKEAYRVLKPGGGVLVLEFSLPQNRMIGGIYLLYLRHVLPWVGALISGDGFAYRYLNETIETFPYGEAFCRLLRLAGFTHVFSRPLAFGIATVYHGRKVS